MSQKINSKSLKKYQKISIADGSKAYADLRQTITKAGILDRSYLYYTVTIIFIYLGFFTSLYGITVTNHYPLVIVLGIVFAFFAVQMTGLLHDAGHRAICKTSKANDIVGNICGAIIAGVYNSWKVKHNMHHAHPNQDDHDPDVEIPLLSFTKEQYRSQKGIGKLLRRYQVYLFFPVGLLVIFSLRITGVKFILKEKSLTRRIINMCILLAGIFIWFILPFIIFGFEKALLLFVVVNTTMGFYLFNIFAPNHKGMPKLTSDIKISFLEQQILTSRNIYGGIITDFLYLGLNYQIEHHLFPNCPRNKLHLITPYVLNICKERKLEYTAVGVIQSNKIILSELRDIARQNGA